MWADHMRQMIYDKFDALEAEYMTVEFAEHKLLECLNDWEPSLEPLSRRQEDLLDLADALLSAAPSTSRAEP